MVLKVSLNTGINRIRLEFKGHQDETAHDDASEVLIESDWNLKLPEPPAPLPSSPY